MPEFELCEAAPPYRRLVTFTSATDPKDEEACVALLRRIAKQHSHQPAEVLLRHYGRRIWEYRT